MRTFDIDGKKYVQINGKSFYLLRGYRIRYEKWAMVQVFGTAPLTKDDLPEKNWELIVTKEGGRRVFTAWKPGFFDGTNEKRLFVGVTRDAGLRLLFQTHDVPPSNIERAIRALSGTEYPPYHAAGIDATQDDGNAGIPAFTLDRPYTLPYWLRDLPQEDA
jgi:hypothetical protein